MTEAGGRVEAGRELDRIVFFSGGVFAIAITIPVLDIRSPDGLSPAEPLAQVLALGPKYLSYAIRFLVLAVYWQAHHRDFKPIRGYDGTLVWLNFLFPMAFAFLLFPTSLLGEYNGEQVPVAIYAANAAGASHLLSAISWYALKGHRLVALDPDNEEQKLRRMQGLAVPVVFLASIGISFISSMVALCTPGCYCPSPVPLSDGYGPISEMVQRHTGNEAETRLRKPSKLKLVCGSKENLFLCGFCATYSIQWQDDKPL